MLTAITGDRDMCFEFLLIRRVPTPCVPVAYGSRKCER